MSRDSTVCKPLNLVMTYLPLWIKIKDFPQEYFSGPNQKVFDFIKEGVSEESANSVDMSWQNAIAIQPNWTMAHIAKEIGLFPSVSQARKNGWDKEIEQGYSEKGGIGKQKLICYFIWNP